MSRKPEGGSSQGPVRGQWHRVAVEIVASNDVQVLVYGTCARVTLCGKGTLVEWAQGGTDGTKARTGPGSLRARAGGEERQRTRIKVS